MEMPANREVVVVQARPMSLAVVRMQADAEELTQQIESAFAAVYEAVNSGQIQQPGHNVIVYRRLESGDVEVECGVQVTSCFAGAGGVIYRETPGGRAATTTHHGPYDGLGESHRELVVWVRSHGLQLTGLRWEIYGDWSDDPQELRVEIFHQVAEDNLI